MEDLLSRAGSQAVTFAIRSGISLASGYAIKTLTKFMDKLPEDEKSPLEATMERLHTKIDIITPAMDLIELISARGNTSLGRTVELTRVLKEDIEKFELQVEQINDQIAVAAAAAAQSGSGQSKKEKASNAAAAKAVEQYMNSLIFRIEDAIPLISLALTTSGANLSSRLPDSVSPGRLLQAANHLSIADTKFVEILSKSTKRKRLTPNPVPVGPQFVLKLYTVYYATARNPLSATAGDITWKEQHAKCTVQLQRIYSVGKKYCYQLSIEEDLNDTRYHEPEELEGGGAVRNLDVSTITRLFFSASGRLLEIDDAKTPVLVLKVNNAFGTDNTGDDDPVVEWLAFELYEEDEDDVEEVDDFSDGETEASEGASSDGVDEIVEKTGKLAISQPEKVSLSLLEYLIRLCALQVNDQESMYLINDERIALYLQDEAAGDGGQSAETSAALHTLDQANHGSPSAIHLSEQHRRRRTSGHRSPKVSSPLRSPLRSPMRSTFRPSSSPSTPLTKRIVQRRSNRGTPSGTAGNSPEGVPTTPWEKDRVLRNPALRAALEATRDSPLRSYPGPRRHERTET